LLVRLYQCTTAIHKARYPVSSEKKTGTAVGALSFLIKFVVKFIYLDIAYVLVHSMAKFMNLEKLKYLT
jgi:hypothetical protein